MFREEEKNILEMKEDEIIAKLKGDFTMPTAKVIVESLGIPVELKGLTRKELEREKKKSIHGKKQVINNAEYDANVIIAATTNFDWGSAKPENISTTAEFLMRKLPAGILSNLAGKVLELSGFGDELEEAEDIKNSSESEE